MTGTNPNPGVQSDTVPMIVTVTFIVTFTVTELTLFEVLI